MQGLFLHPKLLSIITNLTLELWIILKTKTKYRKRYLKWDRVPSYRISQKEEWHRCSRHMVVKTINKMKSTKKMLTTIARFSKKKQNIWLCLEQCLWALHNSLITSNNRLKIKLTKKTFQIFNSLQSMDQLSNLSIRRNLKAKNGLLMISRLANLLEEESSVMFI